MSIYIKQTLISIKVANWSKKRALTFESFESLQNKKIIHLLWTIDTILISVIIAIDLHLLQAIIEALEAIGLSLHYNKRHWMKIKFY